MPTLFPIQNDVRKTARPNIVVRPAKCDEKYNFEFELGILIECGHPSITSVCLSQMKLIDER